MGFLEFPALEVRKPGVAGGQVGDLSGLVERFERRSRKSVAVTTGPGMLAAPDAAEQAVVGCAERGGREPRAAGLG